MPYPTRVPPEMNLQPFATKWLPPARGAGPPPVAPVLRGEVVGLVQRGVHRAHRAFPVLRGVLRPTVLRVHEQRGPGGRRDLPTTWARDVVHRDLLSSRPHLGPSF